MSHEKVLAGLGILRDRLARLYAAVGPLEKQGHIFSDQIESLWRKLVLSDTFSQYYLIAVAGPQG